MKPENEQKEQNPRSLQQLVGARRKPSSVLMLATMAALAMGGAGMGFAPYRSREEGYEPTEHDKERLRLAVERRKRRAEKKAENQRRAEAGKRPNERRSATADQGGCHVR